MKLRKQAPAKAFIVVVTTGLFFALLGLVRSEPRIKAQEPEPTPSSIDYQRFFAPSTAPRGDVPPVTTAPPRPHTRSRAS